MQEVLALLLPVAAASGWFAAVKHAEKQSSNNLNRLNHAYFQGLNHLLNEQPDKALDIFVSLLEEGNETVETHLALGNLFRRRGEIERAIGIHKRLLEHKDLRVETRRQTIFELGMDYMRAGLYDRAEDSFLQLADGGASGKAALEQLLNIYQQEKDWLKAIEYKRKLDQIEGDSRDVSIAHFFCELALEARELGNTRKAFTYLEDALAENRCCVRASLIEAEMYMLQGNYYRALETIKRVENQNPTYLCEVLNPLVKCFESLNAGEEEEEIKYLNHLNDHYTIPSVTEKIAKILERKEGDERAIAFLFDSLESKTTIQGINMLISMLGTRYSGEMEKILIKLRDYCSALLVNQMGYRCEQCGFSGKQLHWCCPGCHHWETITPVVMDL